MKNNTGITLIALVITIIIFLILTGISINMLFGAEGILTKAQTATQKYQNVQEEEEVLIAKISNSINSNRDDSDKIAKLEQEIAELKKRI